MMKLDAVADPRCDQPADPHQGDRAGGQRGDLGQRFEARWSNDLSDACEFNNSARKPYDCRIAIIGRSGCTG
jgi:hypothetical protein